MKKGFLSIYLIFFLSILYMPEDSFSQNVGIGTTVPAFKLDVKTGSINTDSIYRINSFPVLSIAGAGNLFVGRQAGQVTTGSFNTFSGNLSGIANTTANFNSFFGAQAGSSNTSGSSNSFFGHIAGALNVTGYSNVAFGKAALFSNDVGHNNVAIGDSALYNQAANVINLAIGSKAGFSNATAGGGAFIGYQSGYSNTSGGRNSFLGYQSGYSNSIGFGNSFVGYQSGYSNIGGFGNSFFGDSAGYSNIYSQYNTFVGYRSGLGNTDGFHNSFFGALSGYNNTGHYNCFFGSNAGFSNLNGPNNCFFGVEAGFTNTTGAGLTVVGTSADVLSSNLVCAAAIGWNAKVGCSNCLALGGTTAGNAQTRVGINNTTPVTDLHIIQQSDAGGDKVRGIRLQRSVNTNHWRTLIDPSNNYIFEYNDVLYSYVEPVGGAFVNPSDERLKTGIAPLPGVMDKLLLLQPKTYQYIATKDAGRFSYGFIAQEVEKLFPEFVFTSEDGTKGIAYSNFSVIAIKAIQEQQEIIKRLQIQVEADKMQMQAQAVKQQKLIDALLEKNEQLEKRISALENK